MAQARPAPVAHADEFRPQSKLFQAPPGTAAADAAAGRPADDAAGARSRAEACRARCRSRLPMAPQRMPRVEDFPPVVKAEVEAKSRPVDHEDTRPDGPAEAPDQRPDPPRGRAGTACSRRSRASRSCARPAPEARRLASQDAQLYAPRRGQLDDQGRLAPQARATQEDDQLEIPAFLRRQAN